MENNKLLNSYLENKSIKNRKKIKKFISKLLISFILVFSCLIISEKNENFKNSIDKYVFKKSIDFSFFKKIFSIKDLNVTQSRMVFGENITFSKSEKYLNGYKYELESEQNISSIESGIVVFLGKNKDYGNSIIIQGSNGYDILYGNLANFNVKIYDYIDKNTLLGNATDYIYIEISKDKEYYSYEEYQNKI